MRYSPHCLVLGFYEIRFELLRRAGVLPAFPVTLFFVFEPVLVLLAVGHGGSSEGLLGS
jgi:hypothetical protein